jgi:hypothetical protein
VHGVHLQFVSIGNRRKPVAGASGAVGSVLLLIAADHAARPRLARTNGDGDERMAPRLTPTKVARWVKRIDAANANIASVLDEVMAQAANPKAKHYQDLCDLRTDLRRVTERVELCMTEAARIKA